MAETNVINGSLEYYFFKAITKTTSFIHNSFYNCDNNLIARKEQERKTGLFSDNFILFLNFCILFLMHFHIICLLFFFCGILILFSKYFSCICKYDYFTKFRNRLNQLLRYILKHNILIAF